MRAQKLGQRTRLRSAPTLPQKLHPNIAQLVRLVQYHRSDARQQFGHARCAHPRIGKKQMVIHHHQLRLHGPLTRLQDMAIGNLRATRAQAVFARGSHQAGQHRVVLQRTEFGDITFHCAVGPGARRLQQLQILRRKIIGRLVCCGQALRTQVTTAPFEQRHANGKA